MRKILYILLFTFTLFQSKGQNIHLEKTFIDNFFYTVHSFEYDTNNHFYLTGTTGDLDHTPFIARVDSNGNFMDKQTLLPDGKYYSADPLSIVPMDNGTVGIVVAASHSHDVGPVKYFVYQLDSNFNKIWVDSSDGNSAFIHHVLSAGEHLTWMDGKILTTYNKSGNVIAKDSISFYPNSSSNYRDDDTVLLANKSTLYKFDISTYSIINSFDFDHKIIDLLVDTQNIIVATTKSIQYLDDQLTPLHTYTFADSNTYADLAVNASSISVLREPDTSEAVNKLWKFNKQLQVQSHKVHNMPPLQIHKITYNKDQLFSAGINRTQLWLQSWEPNLKMDNEDDDIAITDIRYEVISLDSSAHNPTMMTYDLYITIENYSNTTIDSCMIIAGGSPVWNYYYKTYRLDSVPLLPSSAKEFYLGRNSTYAEGWEYCYELVGPNGQTDTNYSNNSHCITIKYTGIQQPALIQLEVRPNPSSGKFYFELPDQIDAEAMLTLRNLNGKLISRQFINPNHPILNLQSMADGIYFATIRHDQEVYFAKLIKQ